MKRIILLIMAAAVFFVNIAAGQDHYGRSKISKRTFTQEADIRLSIGSFPITYDFDYPFMGMYHDEMDNVRMQTLSERYYNIQTYRGNRITTGSLNINPSIKVLRWMELGVVFSYNGDYRNIYNALDNTVLERDYQHSFFFTPTIRFAWLNKERVRMYSSVGLGLGVLINQNPFSRDFSIFGNGVEWGPSIQLTGFGISFGKTLFGFAEAGAIGTLGIFTAGIGYRVTPKHRK